VTKPEPFQIEEPLSWEQFVVLLGILWMTDDDDVSFAGFTNYLTAAYIYDFEHSRDSRFDHIERLICGWEAIDGDERVDNVPIRLHSRVQDWLEGNRPVQDVNDFLAWAWDNFILWEKENANAA